MTSQPSTPSDEFAQVVWASHILSYLDPYTTTKPEETGNLDAHQRSISSDDDRENSSSADEDLEEDFDLDTASLIVEPLTALDEPIREKFLDSVSELLARAKGGGLVTAATLRELEDSVEIDVARNDGLNEKDEDYLFSTSIFLSLQGEEGHITSITYHSFFEETVSYNSQRIDSWISSSAKWARDALNVDTFANDPLPKSRCASSAIHCVFGCSEKEECSQLQAARRLLWQLSTTDENLSATETDKQRRRMEIVELAAVAIRAPHSMLEFLAAEAHVVKHENMLRSWQLLSRPVSNVRTIARIAKLLPSFRSAKFIAIKPPTLVQLGHDQIIPVQEAMHRLGISIDDDCGMPQPLRRKKSQFKKDCAQGLPSHCETQLLMRYEDDPSLTPTLPYFGCSKKACFLCDSFLSVSPLQPRVRGRHGRCHPRWGMQPRSWEALRPRLIELRDIIKAHIIKILKAETEPDRMMIQQSSIRSELKSEDVHDLNRQAANLQIAEENAKTLRENMQILLDPRSRGPQVILYADFANLCIVCQWATSKCCTRCYASWYCSKRCQKIDWPAHKLLCSRFLKFVKTRPSNNHRLGIWFPRDKKRPQLVWAAFAVEGNYHFPVFDSFLGQLNCVSWTLRFWENKRRGCTSDHPLTIYYRDYDEITNKSVYHCVEACQGVTVPSNLTGEYVVMNGEPRGPIEAFGDMTLADFRHVMDFWSTYYDDTIRDTKNGASILAVKVNCPLEKALFSRDTFSLVAVSYSYPSLQRQVSVLSQVLGDALEILELSRDELEQRAKLLDHHPENAWHNAVAELMMTDIDPASDTWAQTPQKRLFSGSVLILRKDGTDLDVKSVQYMYDYCYEVLRPLFARSLAREMTPDAVLDHITTEKMIAWKPEEAPSRDKEGKPQRGTVAPIFSTYEERD